MMRKETKFKMPEVTMHKIRIELEAASGRVPRGTASLQPAATMNVGLFKLLRKNGMSRTEARIRAKNNSFDR